MFDDNTLKALLVGAALYFGARWLAGDKGLRWRPRVLKGGKHMKKLVLMAALALALAQPAQAASVWQALSGGIGGQAVWVDEGGASAFRDAEATFRASLGVTPHVNVVGGVSYGVDKSYLRGSGGVRLTATDVNDPTFSVGIGISRHYQSEPGAGLDEAAAEAAIGWKPLPGSRVLLTGLACYGIDTGRRVFSAGVVWPFKVVN